MSKWQGLCINHKRGEEISLFFVILLTVLPASLSYDNDIDKKYTKKVYKKKEDVAYVL